MTTGKPFLTLMTLCLGITVGCASPQQKATSRGDKPPIVEALDGMCRQVRTVAGDPSICPQDRRRALHDNADWKQIGTSEQGREIGKAVAAARSRRYAALVALAEQAGQPGWSCAELGRFIDEDASFVHPKLDSQFLGDLDELCRLTEKNNREVSDIALRADVTYKQVRQHAGCAMKELLDALSGVNGATRYSVMQQTAAEAGKPGWQCAALEPSKRHD